MFFKKENEEMIFFLSPWRFSTKKEMEGKNVYWQICCAFDLSSDLYNHIRLLANRNRNSVREKKNYICHCGIRKGSSWIVCGSTVMDGWRRDQYTYIYIRHFPFWRLGLNNERMRGAVRMPIKGCYTKRLLGRCHRL
jgi:hypothetical protein